jgi:hypothetical protein
VRRLPKTLLSLALAAPLLGWAEGGFRRPRWDPPAGTGAPGNFRLGFDLGVWSTNTNLRAKTATSSFKMSGPIQFVAPRVEMDFADLWTGSLRLELGEGDNAHTQVYAAHLSRPVWDFGDALLNAHFGPIFGKLDERNFPGEFDDAFGLDAGADFSTPISQGWTARLGATLRYIKFDYKRGVDVLTASDNRVGALGLVVSAGLASRF